MARSAEQIYDELLVLRCEAGDRAAFAELVERWQPRLFGHALRLTGRPDVASDVVQETWIAVIRELPRLADPAAFGGLAHRIVTRRCADWGRTRARQRRMADELADGGAPGNAATAEQTSDAARVRQVVGELPSDGRVVVALHYLYELSIAEIAKTLRIPAGTVKSRLHKARAQLRHALTPKSARKTRSETCPS